MKTRTLTHTATAILGSRRAVTGDRRIVRMLFGVSSPTAEQEAITVLLPHGEMKLHSVGGVLSRGEYYKLTQAVGLVEARACMSRHGLKVGTVPSAGSDLGHFAQALAA